MSPQEHSSLDSAASDIPTSFNRRNLPRASHACQWCRAKKAKCNQRQPCSNCIKHSVDCEYGVRRRNGRNRNIRTQSQGREEVVNRQDHVVTLASIRRDQDESRGSETPGRTQEQESAHLAFTPQTWPSHGSDVVGDVNQRTHGTEFYGTSSNFVLLNQFSAFAQQHLPRGHASFSGRGETSHFSAASFGGNEQSSFPGDHVPRFDLAGLPQGRISIINLLSNEDSLSPPSRPKTPQGEPGKQSNDMEIPLVAPSPAKNGNRSNSIQHDSPSMGLRSNQRGHAIIQAPSSDHTNTQGGPASVSPKRLAERRLEREYVRTFMNNLHHIHPMLDSTAFTARCEEEIWEVHPLIGRKKHSKHFLALYNIVVAVGALIAGSSLTQFFGKEIELCSKRLTETQSSARSDSSQALSKIYFRRSMELLGNVFEVCSLESAQTLLLMSLYCQNSHKPHACYMYCGHAVRTALAIGLPNESMSSSAEDRKVARRTWWCIYSHEIDMSCSSGRRDSLGKPRNYQLPLPLIKEQGIAVPNTLEIENNSVAMINEMVHFAAVLRRVSKELYHDSKGLTLLQKSSIAEELDGLLDEWKAQLPEWLDFRKVSFREEEWAAKQKLVLHLRYLNARILVHRPFLAPLTSRGLLQKSTHVESCLVAARETIRVLYDAYAHRHYFRTWWYNSTYTLYAGMIVLYIVILGQTTVCSTELFSDVIKAQEVLQSMDEAPVARRSADLIREGLEVARACVQYRQNNFTLLGETRQDQDNDELRTQVGVEDLMSNAEHNISRTLFSCTGHGPDPGGFLASLIDPNLLQDFTSGMTTLLDTEVPTFSLDGFYDDGPDSGPMPVA